MKIRVKSDTVEQMTIFTGSQVATDRTSLGIADQKLASGNRAVAKSDTLTEPRSLHPAPNQISHRRKRTVALEFFAGTVSEICLHAKQNSSTQIPPQRRVPFTAPTSKQFKAT